MFRIEWAASPVAYKKTPPTDATRGGVRALQTLLFGRSNKQCEQSNHAHSDNQHCKCYGIVVQPIQPLLHDTPPLRSETATKAMPSGRLAFPLSIKKVRREPAGRSVFRVGSCRSRALLLNRRVWQVPARRSHGARRGRPVPSFDHLVGAGEERRRNFDAQYARGLRVDDKLELGGLHDGQSAGLAPLRMRPT